MQTHSV